MLWRVTYGVDDEAMTIFVDSRFTAYRQGAVYVLLPATVAGDSYRGQQVPLSRLKGVQGSEAAVWE